MGAALDWAALGLAVFPCRGKYPAKPKAAGGRGVHDATTHPKTIRSMWTSYPWANVGLAMGEPSGVWALDVDPRHRGDKSLALLEAEYGRLPDTMRQRTGSGGVHYLFRYDGEPIRNKAGVIAEGLDVRATGGYVIGSPSIHPDTRKPYKLEGPSTFAPAPAWLVDLAVGLDEWAAQTPAPACSPPPADSWGPWPAYTEAALDLAARAISAAGDGEQEVTLSRESFGIGRLVGGGYMPADFAKAVLVHAGLSMIAYRRHQPWTRAEVERRVDRALHEGAARPRVPEGRR